MTEKIDYQEQAITIINAFETQGNEILARVDGIVSIESDAEALEATDMLKECNTFLNNVEKQRKAITDPLNKFVKDMIALATKVSKGGEDAKTKLKTLIVDYNQRQEKKKMEELQKAQEAQAKLDVEAMMLEVQDITDEEKARLDSAKTPEQVQQIKNEIELRKFREQKKIDEQKQQIQEQKQELEQKQEAIQQNVKNDAPKGIYKVKLFQITDANAVPRVYCVPNETLIRQAVQGGIESIEGVRIREETRVK